MDDISAAGTARGSSLDGHPHCFAAAVRATARIRGACDCVRRGNPEETRETNATAPSLPGFWASS